MGRKDRYGQPRLFLSKFMLLPAYLFTAHFLYFAPFPAIYPYFEPLLAIAGLLVFPLYYIYFRLLTVDEWFSFKKHSKYLAFPAILGLVYTIIVLLTPMEIYAKWLFHPKEVEASTLVKLLDTMRILVRLAFLIQLVFYTIGNHLLIAKYGDKAEQFYSNCPDSKNSNSRLLNYSIIAMSIASFAAVLFGREILMPNNILIYFIWSVFSVSLFLMGHLGLKQNPINPTFEPATAGKQNAESIVSTVSPADELMDKIHNEFVNNKIYLNSELTIIDVAKLVGSNRTYISGLINQNYGQNFCAFVNGFRVAELEKVIVGKQNRKVEQLADDCGFGSVNSMKRAVESKTGMSFYDFKNHSVQP